MSLICLLTPLYYLLYCIYLTHQNFKEKKELILLNVINWARSEIRKIRGPLILLMLHPTTLVPASSFQL
jgi:hypothetical protein